MRVEHPVSAGGIVYRKKGQDIEILLCGHRGPASWRLPKGTPDPGETWEQTAIREVREETGLKVEIEEGLGSIEYWFSADGVRNHKTVHFFLMRPVGGSIEKHDPEFDLVQWFNAEDVEKTLTYKNEAEIAKKALGTLANRRGEVSDDPAR
ncbi:MAG: NUDIX hydrolase [Dehalococcoidia bacterium]